MCTKQTTFPSFKLCNLTRGVNHLKVTWTDPVYDKNIFSDWYLTYLVWSSISRSSHEYFVHSTTSQGTVRKLKAVLARSRPKPVVVHLGPTSCGNKLTAQRQSCCQFSFLCLITGILMSMNTSHLYCSIYLLWNPCFKFIVRSDATMNIAEHISALLQHIPFVESLFQDHSKE